MKVTLEKVFKNVKETKFGPKLSVGLKIRESKVTDIEGKEVIVGDRYLNAWFKPDFNFAHDVGDSIDILIKQRGEWLDFSIPKPGENTGALADLAARVARLEAHCGLTTTEPEPPSDPDDF